MIHFFRMFLQDILAEGKLCAECCVEHSHELLQQVEDCWNTKIYFLRWIGLGSLCVDTMSSNFLIHISTLHFKSWTDEYVNLVGLNRNVYVVVVRTNRCFVKYTQYSGLMILFRLAVKEGQSIKGKIKSCWVSFGSIHSLTYWIKSRVLKFLILKLNSYFEY